MKSRYFAFAWIFLVASLLQTSAGACDHCKSKCRQCDNRGLMDLADSLFGKLHSQTKKIASACKPAAGSRSCDRAPKCGCEVAPTCGCEQEPSCGCEVAPTCGCEIGPSCGCENTPTSLPPQWQPQAQPLSAPVHQHMHYPPPQPQPQAPIQSHQTPEQQFTPEPRYFTPAPPPPSLQHSPDIDVDPFMDDAATRVRKIPAHAIRHSQALPYGNSYDPQASSEIRYRLNDDQNETVRSDGVLATNSSSRTRTARAIASYKESRETAPKDNVVVTASGTSLRAVPQTNAKRLPSTNLPTNPLRR